MAVKNDKGLASLETMALLVIFGVLMGYGIGYFGVVHTGILNSIAARSYAFETFDNRVDLTYFRSNREERDLPLEHYRNYGFRAHGINTNEPSPRTQWEVTQRSISIGRPTTGIVGPGFHDDIANNPDLHGPERRGVNPVWIKVVYGICITFECGGAGS